MAAARERQARAQRPSLAARIAAAANLAFAIMAARASFIHDSTERLASVSCRRYAVSSAKPNLWTAAMRRSLLAAVRCICSRRNSPSAFCIDEVYRSRVCVAVSSSRYARASRAISSLATCTCSSKSLFCLTISAHASLMSLTFPRWGRAAEAPREMPSAALCAKGWKTGFDGDPAVDSGPCVPVPMAVVLELRTVLPTKVPALDASAWPPKCCCGVTSVLRCCGLTSVLRARCLAAVRGPGMAAPEAAAATVSCCRASRMERMACCRAFIRCSGSTGLGKLRDELPASARSAQLPEDCFPHRELLEAAGPLALPLARRAASRPRATSTSSCDGPPLLPSADVCKERKRLSTADSTSD
mmetsp:Transcript_16312/g.29972  ORF Transcript_16312/g.29972 Transcript_16312/m.29972 type:complete len:358 (+) Transcript_16312:491-1564(+)